MIEIFDDIINKRTISAIQTIKVCLRYVMFITYDTLFLAKASCLQQTSNYI